MYCKTQKTYLKCVFYCFKISYSTNLVFNVIKISMYTITFIRLLLYLSSIEKDEILMRVKLFR